jgi:hypothetical protein
MTFNACIDAAAEAGQISQRRARQIKDEIERKARRKRQALGAEIAQLQAADEVAEELRHQSIRTRRNAILAENARQRLVRDLTGFRSRNGEADMFEAAMAALSHYGYAGFASVRGSAEAITSLVHARLGDAQLALKRQGILGRRSGAQRALTSNIVKEILGEGTGDTAAKGFADAMAAEFEYLRQRFNAAGGEIGKLDNYLPQSHDRRAMFYDGRRRMEPNAARERWTSAIRPLLDVTRMRDPRTGRALSETDLDEALDYAWASITSDGSAHLTPQGRSQGRGSLANQRADHRFLVFKDADSWMTYNRQFGIGDPVQSMFNHVNDMARDIAALERLGPNPDATIEWLKQIVTREGGRQLSGLHAALAKRRGMDFNRYATWRLDSLWTHLRGRSTVSNFAANAAADLRNVATSATLGATGILALTTDPFIARASRRLAGLPVASDMMGFIGQLFGKGSRDDAVRAGVLWDEYLHVMRDEARYSGPVEGSGWSQYLVDRAMTVNGLRPITNARKFIEARAWHTELGDRAGQAYGDLDPLLRNTLDGFGIDADAWDVMRQGVDDGGFLTPPEIVRRTGNVAVAERYAELIQGWQERAVPTGTPNSQSWLLGTTERGTLIGEAARFALQFKTFGLSFTALQLEAMHQFASLGATRGQRAVRASDYIGRLAIMMTLGGAAYIQLKALASGQDTLDANPTSEDGRAFWVQAIITGGGFGLYGDFIRMSENRFGQSAVESAMGPGPSLLFDTVGAARTLGTAPLAALNADDPSDVQQDVARQTLGYARRWTPVLSSHIATRLAYQRLILDQLQHLTDPNAHRSFRSRATSLRSRTGQEYYWAPGDSEPDRAPDLSAGF